jgi:hypothetical protein
MFKKIILIASFLLIFTAIFSAPITLQAQTSIINPSATGSSGNKPYDLGDYTLDDILAIAIGASRWILGVVGSLALIMFIYGGFMFLISAGSSEKIGQARKILVAAVIGLLIVFASYLIIQFVLKSLGLNWKGEAKPMSRTTSQTILAWK